MSSAFDGRVVLITGAAGGIGAALARRLDAGGARLALLDLEPGPVEALAAELRGDALPVACDVTDADAVREAVERTASHFGGIDQVIAAAGITHRSPFERTSLAVHRAVVEVNYFGTLHVVHAALPWLLERRGGVVGFSSVAGFAPLLGRSSYCASKHALHGLLDTLRAELGPRGLAVLLVCPAFVDTPLASRALDGEGGTVSHGWSTMGRPMEADRVAADVLRAAARRQPRLMVGGIARLSWAISRLAPRLYARLMSRQQRSELEVR